jgi:small-conductance mechanosensitive channel
MITADGHHGEVTRITTRYTVVRSLTGVERSSLTTALVTTTVQNHSYSDRRVRLAVTRAVSYRTDMAEALKILWKWRAGSRACCRNRKPTAQVLQLGTAAWTWNSVSGSRIRSAAARMCVPM